MQAEESVANKRKSYLLATATPQKGAEETRKVVAKVCQGALDT
jgi:hypothetical protein